MGGYGGGGGEFSSRRYFFRYQIRSLNFFSAVARRFIRFNWRARILLPILLRIPCANIFFVLRPPPPPHKFSNGQSLTTLMTPPLRRLKLSCDLWGRIFCLTTRRKKNSKEEYSIHDKWFKIACTQILACSQTLYFLFFPHPYPLALAVDQLISRCFLSRVLGVLLRENRGSVN